MKTTSMTTSISSEALWNYIKDIWKMKVKKISKTTTDRPTDNFFVE